MKEHLLLLFIALVGVSGLLTIHQDVSASQDKWIPYMSSQRAVPVATAADENPRRISQLKIDAESTWPIVDLSISNFDVNSQYYLDYGSGSRERVNDGVHSFEVPHNGNMLIRLIKDEILIDAIELQLPSRQGAQSKLVSF